MNLAALQKELAKKDLELFEEKKRNRLTQKDALKTKENSLTFALKQAKAIQDIDAEVELQTQLSKVAAEKLFFDNQKEDDFLNKNIVEENITENEEIESNPQVQNFLKSNPWLDQRDSKNYDPDLTSSFMEHADLLNKKLRLEGKGELIGSTPYLEILTETIKNKFSGDSNKENSQEDKEEVLNKKSVPEVGAVSMSDNNYYADHNKEIDASELSRLNPDEKRIFFNIAENPEDPKTLKRFLKYKKKAAEKIAQSQGPMNKITLSEEDMWGL